MRLTPSALDLFRRFSPEETKPEITASVNPEKVTARLDITDEGVCPYCERKMRKSYASNFNVWVCDSDRHVAPVKND